MKEFRLVIAARWQAAGQYVLACDYVITTLIAVRWCACGPQAVLVSTFVRKRVRLASERTLFIR